MLKKRIIGVIVVRHGVAVQSINFKKYLPIGRPEICVEFLNQWGIDEIVLLGISATWGRRPPNYEMIRKVSKFCQVPLTIGGGIQKIEHIAELMQCGADRVVVNNAAFNNPCFISEAALKFGQQAVVASIDSSINDGTYNTYDYLAGYTRPESPWSFAQKLEKYGVGEVLINSIDRDGSYRGFDLELINNVCNSVSIPVICCGGAGNARHFSDVFSKTSVSGAGAANYFHFTEHSVAINKALVDATIPLRLEQGLDYKFSHFDENCRILKKPDSELEEMLYLRIDKEII